MHLQYYSGVLWSRTPHPKDCAGLWRCCQKREVLPISQFTFSWFPVLISPSGARGSAAEPQTQAENRYLLLDIKTNAWLHEVGAGQAGSLTPRGASLTITASGSLKLTGSIWDRANWVTVSQSSMMRTWEQKLPCYIPQSVTGLEWLPLTFHFLLESLPDPQLSGSGVQPVVSLSSQGTLTCRCRFTCLPPSPWFSGFQSRLHIRVSGELC